MIPNSYKKLKLNGFIPIPPELQFLALLFVLVATATIILLKELL